MTYDIVYIVRDGDDNEELRHSLRSLRNLPHGNVWIVGYKPTWVDNVYFIEGNKLGTRWVNTINNIKMASETPEISDNFILMNDDFFVMEDISGTDVIDNSPGWWREGLRTHEKKIGRSAPQWKIMLKNAIDCLDSVGIEEQYSFTLHMPLLVDKEKMSHTLNTFPNDIDGVAPEPRSLYGNHWNMARERRGDCKITTSMHVWKSSMGPFASTFDRSFRSGNIGKQIRRMFGTPSPYERS